MLKDVVLSLANALYFKGAWDCPFYESNAKQCKDFYTRNGEIVQVPYVRSFGEWYPYASFKVFKVVKLPYSDFSESTKFAMYIFLPDEKDGLF